jgi:stage IV sporulation protein FB
MRPQRRSIGQGFVESEESAILQVFRLDFGLTREHTQRPETNMKFREGFLVLGHLGRAPIRVHWTTPIVAFVLTGLSFVPGAWLGFLVLVLVHELGHAVAARAFGAEVISINAHGLGGTCEWYGHVTPKQRAIIAWGGVVAQFALLLVAQLTSIIVPSWGFFAQLMNTLTGTNLILIALNLLPIPPLDGAEAWKLLKR